MPSQDPDTCPIEPIPGIGPPENLTSLSWQALQEASDAARHLGVLSPFVCVNCLDNESDDPCFFIEDAYIIAQSPDLAGYSGVCRSCALEMHTSQVAEDRRTRRRRWVLVALGLALLVLILTLW